MALGLLLILASLGFASTMRGFSWVRRHYVFVNAVSGALLIGLGLLLLLGRWAYLNHWLQRAYDI